MSEELSDEDWHIILFCIEKVAVDMRRKGRQKKVEQINDVIEKVDT